jgi:DNA-binding YbaB/EbfC family protein
VFDKAKQLYDFQKKARAIQKELKETEIEARSMGDLVGVRFNGEQHVLGIDIDESLVAEGKKRELEKALQQAVAEAISKSQAVAAEKMKVIAGNLNIPGLG